ncbi:serine protease inhibitor [Pelomyxa schiedti]|nr:serine protease inhibitor [Pelomyxa schiedti]
MASTRPVRCNKGHDLVKFTREQLLVEKQEYQNGFNCDVCRRHYPIKLDASSVMHCSACEFDMCSSCVNTALGVPPTATGTGGAVNLVGSVNMFGLNVLRAVCCGTATNNVFLSPYSIAQILSLMCVGANGSTKSEMLHALCIPEGAANSLAAFYQETNRTIKASRAETIIANSTWAKPSYTFTPAFRTSAAMFDTEAYPMPGTPEPINRWCSDNTKGRINHVVDQIDPSLVLALINALYFKGMFTKAFDESLTQQRPFHNADGTTSHVSMMKRTEKMLYKETDEYQAALLTYGPDHVSPAMCCVVVLPRPSVTVEALLSKHDFWQVTKPNTFDSEKGTLQLPRFKLEFSTELSQTLQHLGMTSAFRSGDFSAMCTPSQLAISAVIHKTFVEVNEKGTEAAAVTAVLLRGCCMPADPPKPPFSMICDKPFLFYILEKSTGVVLFSGKMGSLSS